MYKRTVTVTVNAIVFVTKGHVGAYVKLSTKTADDDNNNLWNLVQKWKEKRQKE